MELKVFIYFRILIEKGYSYYGRLILLRFYTQGIFDKYDFNRSIGFSVFFSPLTLRSSRTHSDSFGKCISDSLSGLNIGDWHF